MLSASTNEPTTNDTPAVTVKAIATVRPIRARMLLRASSAVDRKLMSAVCVLHVIDDLVCGRIREVPDDLAITDEYHPVGV